MHCKHCSSVALYNRNVMRKTVLFGGPFFKNKFKQGTENRDKANKKYSLSV